MLDSDESFTRKFTQGVNRLQCDSSRLVNSLRSLFSSSSLCSKILDHYLWSLEFENDGSFDLEKGQHLRFYYWYSNSNEVFRTTGRAERKKCKIKDSEIYSLSQRFSNRSCLSRSGKKHVIHLRSRDGIVILSVCPELIVYFCNCVCPLLEGPKRIPLGETIPTRHCLS